MIEAGKQSGRGNPDRAFHWSLGGHGFLLLLVLIGGLTLPHSQPPTQLAIKASVVEAEPSRRSSAAPPSKASPKAEPKVEPEVEPKPDPAVEQRREEQQKQERVQAEQREKVLQEKQRTEQRKVEQAAEARQQREKQEKQEKLARDKAAREKQEREKAAADKVQAEKVQAEKLKADRLREQAAEREMARQLEAEERLLAAADSGALAEYQGLIRQKVTRNWIPPPSAGAGLECEIVVTQIPGGEVTGVRIERCNGDAAVRRSIEAAVLKASPLPLPDDPALFERSLRFTFKPEQ